MKRFRKISLIIICAELLLIAACNILYFSKVQSSDGRLYRVEAKRVAYLLNDKAISDIDLKEYSTIIRVSEFDKEENCNNDYVVENVNGILYRIEYRTINDDMYSVYMNFGLFFMMVISIFLLWYVYKHILTPFGHMQHMTVELAKGNLAIPIKEEKNKFFGSFLWGMDMLRQNLEDKREKELELQREKKTLILSLSHDIKTPLSAIELYTKALLENLYDNKEKQEQALKGIMKNTEEIQGYVNEVTKASREDFLSLDVQEEEFYFAEVMQFIKNYYKDKLSVMHTEFIVEQETDCLLKGDRDRLIEVLQNIMENAIKYGDGSKISISFGEEEDCRLIVVENTGTVVSEEELLHLFDSFYRGSNSKNVKGSGLGLYICKSLMKSMDGDIFAGITDNTFRITVVIRRA